MKVFSRNKNMWVSLQSLLWLRSYYFRFDRFVPSPARQSSHWNGACHVLGLRGEERVNTPTHLLPSCQPGHRLIFRYQGGNIYRPGYNIICQEFSNSETKSINYNLGFQYFLDGHDHQNPDQSFGKPTFKIHKIWAFLVLKFLPQIRSAFEFS